MDVEKLHKMNEGRVLRGALPQILEVLRRKRENSLGRLKMNFKEGGRLDINTAEIVVLSELEAEFLRLVREAGKIEEKLNS